MLFNSLAFAIFLPLTLAVYYWLSDVRKQNAWLLACSLFFYASWDWRFLFLLLFTIIVDYLVARRIQQLRDEDSAPRLRRLLLATSIIANLGVLAFFKYYNFFQESVASMAGWMHLPVGLPALHVLLAIGISFYTFQSMSYTIDVYRGHLRAADRLVDFALFVSFFPHLVAGPIMRAVDLLPQILQPRRATAKQAADGIHLIIWGLWKKMFVADHLAPVVNTYFARSSLDGFEVAVAACAFAFQIYGDFSGYTDIARGVAKLFGFELTINFLFPYFSASPQEFWTRWHISLSRWLREYLYFSLGGNRRGAYRTYANLILTMIIGGLWHGAAWNFVLWGLYHGVLLAGHRVLTPVFDRLRAIAGAGQIFLHGLAIAIMFQLTCYGWLLFRAASFGQIVSMTQALFRPWNVQPSALLPLLAFAGPLVAIELAMVIAPQLPRYLRPRFPLEVRVAAYATLAYLALFIAAPAQSFIYFKF